MYDMQVSHTVLSQITFVVHLKSFSTLPLNQFLTFVQNNPKRKYHKDYNSFSLFHNMF